MAKLTRLSKNRKVEYQIEYTPLPAGIEHEGEVIFGSEYRVRRGARGTWTEWFTTANIENLLTALGFTGQEPTWSEDFQFECYFGRGEIRINYPMFKFIARRAGYQPLNTYLYARLKQVEPEVWILPASALDTKERYEHMRDVIQAHS